MSATRLVFIIWLFCTSLPSAVWSQQPINGESPSNSTATNGLLEKLVSTNHSTRLDAAMRLDQGRNDIVQKLLEILEGTNDMNVKVDAVVVLGEYRSAEAVPSLVQHWEELNYAILGGPRFKMTDEETEEHSHPVTSALMKIGMPAIPVVLDKIKKTDDPHLLEECVQVCRSVEGADIAQMRLQHLYENETNQENRIRIQAAQNLLQTIVKVLGSQTNHQHQQ